MTREEQIEQASVEYQMSNNPMCIGGDAFADMTYKLNINPSFIAGAKWADKTIIDKACEWLIRGGYFVNNTESIEDFRKAMQNE